MVQIFFDANVWIDYCWRKQFSKNRGKRKKPAILVHKLKTRKTKVTITLPLLYEVSSHFKDYFILEDVIADGFSAFEFSKVKRDYQLKRKKRKKVDEIYDLLTSIPCVKDQMLLDWLSEKTFEKVFKLTGRYDIEFLDCLHIVAALIANCEVFVTKDGALLNKVKLASKRFRSFQRIGFMRPPEFQDRFAKLFKK